MNFWIISQRSTSSIWHSLFFLPKKAGKRENIEAKFLLIDREFIASYGISQKWKNFIILFLCFVDALSIFTKSLFPDRNRRKKNPFIPEYEFSAIQREWMKKNPRFIEQKLIYRQSPLFDFFPRDFFNHSIKQIEKMYVNQASRRVQDKSDWIISLEKRVPDRGKNRLIGVETNWKPPIPSIAFLIEA